MSTSHQDRERQAAESAIKQGHSDPTALRKLLSFTTSKNTSALVEAYFRAHHGDANLVSTLVETPWKARMRAMLRGLPQTS